MGISTEAHSHDLAFSTQGHLHDKDIKHKGLFQGTAKFKFGKDICMYSFLSLGTVWALTSGSWGRFDG